MQHKIKIALITILAAILVTIIFQNTETTKLELFVWEIEASRIFVFGGFTFFGFLLGALSAWMVLHSWKKNHDN
ncbi:MAG: hypothetical protein P1V20_11985 [Verrucomicrobiales bacterium]|nr:hypothetical protein [Verrucomicrobiales bacterium]